MLDATLIVIAILLLALEVKFGTYGAATVVAAVLLSIGLIGIMHDLNYWHPALPVAVSAALAIIASFQGYLGFRARKNKRLAGIEELIGKIGVSRTVIGKRGTVFVRGEYWQASSDNPIPAGVDVRIERVDGLLLYVKEA
jgi:membrane-bound serine protease (ClpP class)